MTYFWNFVFKLNNSGYLVNMPLNYSSLHPSGIIRCLAQTQRQSASAAFCLLQVFGRRIVSMVYWAVSFPAAGAAADAVCCLLAEKTHRDQLICTVINRKETFERERQAKSQPGRVTVKRSHLTRTFIWLMDYILRVWTLL